MMRIEEKNWKALFGDPPESFQNRVETTARRMARQDRPAIKTRFVPALVLTLVLLAGVALALNSLGVLDTLSKTLRNYLQPGATELVQGSIAQEGGVLSNATFTVEEAINDGRQIYVTIRVHAADPEKVLLIDEQSTASTGMDWWKDYDFEAGQTYSANAHETGRDLIRANLFLDEAMHGRYEWDASQVHYDGEDILYTLTLMSQSEGQEEVALTAHTYYVYGDDMTDEARREQGSLRFTVPITDARTTYAAAVPLPMPKAGLILEVLRLEQTPIATYLTAAYRLAPDATDLQALNLRDGIWPNWLDENGALVPDGQSSLGLVPTGEDGYTVTIAYRAMETIPGKITLEFFSGMSKERFDIPTLSLTKIEGESK